jgi:hypothetical protein
MWEVCWSDTNEISLTTCSAGPQLANIILDIFWHHRYIFHTYPSGVGCIINFSCLVVILTDFCNLFDITGAVWDPMYMYSLYKKNA